MSIHPNGGASKWRRASTNAPCPICKGTDWCSLSADGALAKCQRAAEGAFKTKKDKNGAEYYLHRLDGAAPAAPPPPPVPNAPVSERAGPDVLHRVYSALLSGLKLSDAHRDNLRRRGLADDEIDRRGYRTLAVHGRAALARGLREQFGDVVLSVPGFVVKPGDRGSYVTIAGAAGMLAPIRDPSAHVVALLARRDDASDGKGKYLYLSSTAAGGPGPGAPVHIPIGVAGPVEVVRVTEGTIKADIAFALSGVPTIGLPGVSSWRPALSVLRELGAKTARLAFDADAADKPPVARPLVALAGALTAEGIAVELERWSAERKGIDDALAAGATVEVLTGDAARQAIDDALTEATAGEPIPEPGPLGRLASVLAEGGAEGLYRDGELLRALARLAEENAAEFMCVRTRLQYAGVKLRDLDKVLAPLRKEVRRECPPPDAGGCYRVVAGRIVRDVMTPNGPVETALCNFTARIVGEIIHDDGAERRITLAVEGALADGTPLARVEVPADQFPLMRWIVQAWGTRAVVFAGASTADHLRAAIQLLSGDVPRLTVYGHTGWREIGGGHFYLHAAGAIGAAGAVEGVSVALDGALTKFQLPAPPEGAGLVEAVCASLRLLDLGPWRIATPVFAAIYRAALGAPDFSGFLCGPTGAFKTELAALAQQHYGAGMDSRNLPGSWGSTGNALEGVSFAAKDALVVVDDFAPTGSAHDVQRMHREADRVLRAQGNRAGRGRCRRDGTPQPAKPPRGLILSTGEDVPRGQSLRARSFVAELSKGDITAAELTECQRDAAAGLYAACMAGFVRWLAPRYGDVRAGLRQEHAELRDRALADGNGQHARTPGITADLAIGLKYFLDFAVEAGVLTVVERDALAKRCWSALCESAAAQAGHVEAAEPCGQFLRLLAGALASGRAHVAGPDGAEPIDPDGWGWRGTGTACAAQGRRIGWLTGDDLYLEPEAAYAEAQEMARQQGDSLAVSARTLWKRLDERGLLVGRDRERQRYTVRRRLQGSDRREVLHLRQDALTTCAQPSQPSPPPSDGENPRKKAGATGDGSGDGCTRDGDNRPPDRPRKTAGKAERNGDGDGWDGQKQVVAHTAPEKNSSGGKRVPSGGKGEGRGRI